MTAETAYDVAPQPAPLKGPGTSKAELETLLYGLDSDRADTVQAHAENGMDLATIMAFVAAHGRGGFVGVPSIGAAQALNDTTDTELTGTRFTVQTSGGVAVVEADLIFSADADGVDVTDLMVGTAAGFHVSLGWIEYTGTGGTRQTDVVSNVFTANPHAAVIDIPAGGNSLVRMRWIVSNAVGNDFWIQAKSNDDTGGTSSFAGGMVRAYELATSAASGIFVGAASTP